MACPNNNHFYKLSREGFNYRGQETVFTICRKCGDIKEMVIDKRIKIPMLNGGFVYG
jgi:hypothetical protein